MWTRAKNSLPLYSLLLLIAMLVIAAPAAAQRPPIFEPDTGEVGTGGTYIIQGSVFFPSGQRVDRRIRVRLFTPTRGDMTLMTDDNGRFTFRRLSPGSYEIVIDDEKDYAPVRQAVNIFQVSRGGQGAEQIHPVQIRLELKGSRNLKPGVVSTELADVPKRALSFYNKALDLASQGNSKGAIEQLQQAVNEHPKFTLAFIELGAHYLRIGELDKAEQALRSALEIKPDSFTALVNQGIVLVRLKRYADAEIPLRLALKQKDDSAVAHYYLGRALAYLGRYDIAEVELNLAVAFGGEEMKEAHRYLAGVYNARGKPQRAIAELELYLKLAPQSPDANHLREMIAKLRASIPPKK